MRYASADFRFFTPARVGGHIYFCSMGCFEGQKQGFEKINVLRGWFSKKYPRFFAASRNVIVKWHEKLIDELFLI